jgi:hypothetical protein
MRKHKHNTRWLTRRETFALATLAGGRDAPDVIRQMEHMDENAWPLEQQGR